MTGCAAVMEIWKAVMRYMDEFYFESAAMILTLITVGKMLEAQLKGKDNRCLKESDEACTKAGYTDHRDGKENGCAD